MMHVFPEFNVYILISNRFILKEINIAINGQLRYSIFSGWSITSLKIDFSVKKIEVKFVGIPNEVLWNKLFTKVGAPIVNLMWTQFEPMVTTVVEQVHF